MSMSMFEIGKSALMASRTAMEVTGHNLSNVSTPGYSRQEAVLESIIQRQATVSGMGVKVSQIRRLRDFFTDSILRNETASLNWFAVQRDITSQIQVMTAESTDDGLRSVFEEFSATWQELSMDPDSQPGRAALVEKARTLVDTFRHMNSQLESLQEDVGVNITANVNRVNDLAERIAVLNGEIARANARQSALGDLMDRRDLLLDEIAELTGATVTRYNDGTEAVRVTVNGHPLVDRTTSYKMSASLGHPIQFNWIDAAGDAYAMEVGGKLGGLAVGSDQIAGGFKQELENLMKSVVDAVNTQYALGAVVTDPVTDPPASPDPLAFFVVGDPSDYLGTVQVAPEILADPSKIAAWNGDLTDVGNGLNALAIADIIGGEPISTWTGIIGRLGSEAQKITSGFQTEELLVKEIQNRKDSISGVSMDDEIADLVREQHAFNAASRLISTADELLETVIMRMGAGR